MAWAFPAVLAVPVVASEVIASTSTSVHLGLLTFRSYFLSFVSFQCSYGYFSNRYFSQLLLNLIFIPLLFFAIVIISKGTVPLLLSVFLVLLLQSGLSLLLFVFVLLSSFCHLAPLATVLHL